MNREPATLVWLRDRSRGSRPVITEDRIVRAAIELADAEGIDALSMRRLAAELGSGTTSIYRYVSGKDELIELMVDAVHGETTPPPDSGRHWREDLADVARGIRADLLRHPWLAQQASRRPALGPNVIARSDYALGVAGRATPDATLASLIVGTVHTHVLGAVSVELADLAAQHATGQSEVDWQKSVGAWVGRVVESGEFPHFNRRVVEAEERGAEDRFEFGLRCLLDGFAAALA